MSSAITVSVLIPLYKGADTITRCLESVLAQDYHALEVLMLDNGCPDRTGDEARSFMEKNSAGTRWEVLHERRNTGFASGMNRLYMESSGEYILFLNQDVVLFGNHVKLLAESLKNNPAWAGACGTLFRWQKPDGSRMVDTTGHAIFRSRIVRNRGAGLLLNPGENPPYEQGEIFGMSAACSLYRRDAIESAREPDGPFDPDFFSYFEDIDLDYRLRRAGWSLGYVPGAAGTHALAGSGARRELYVRLRAYGNRRRLLVKHETFSSLLPDFPPILAQDAFSSLRALFSDPLAWLLGPFLFWISLPKVLARRKNLAARFGHDMSWIRQWLNSDLNRFY